MATVNFIQNRRPQTTYGMRRLLEYSQQDFKTIHDGHWLVTGIGCNTGSAAYDDFMRIKQDNSKPDGRLYYHLDQSFHPDENVTPEQAHAIAVKLADFYKGFQVLVATHIDREHCHSHLIVNSVSMEDGKKLRSPNDALVQLRKLSDQLCREQGLTVLEEYKPSTPSTQLNQREYRSALRGDSWKFTLIRAIDDALLRSSNRDEFVQNMEYEGILVKWTPSRKNITYTMPDGKKCRDDKLHDPQYLKANLELLFEQRERDGFVPFTPEPEGGWIAKPEQVENPPQTGALVHDVLSLGRNLERIPQANKSAPKIGHVDHRVRQREKIKQLAAGHKLRDELDQEQQYANR